MMERLCVEYDKVVLRGLSILIGRRQQRLWQFLTLAPLAHLRRRAKFEFWWQLHRQIGCPPAATDADPSAAVERLDGQFWTVLVAALVQLPEPDLFVFLVTLSSLVDAQSPADDPLRQLVAWELSQLGLVDDVARPLCFKTAKEQLADQILQCPGLFSFLLHRWSSRLTWRLSSFYSPSQCFVSDWTPGCAKKAPAATAAAAPRRWGCCASCRWTGGSRWVATPTCCATGWCVIRSARRSTSWP